MFFYSIWPTPQMKAFYNFFHNSNVNGFTFERDIKGLLSFFDNRPLLNLKCGFGFYCLAALSRLTSPLVRVMRMRYNPAEKYLISTDRLEYFGFEIA